MKRRTFVKDGIAAVPALAVFGLPGIAGEAKPAGKGGPRRDRKANRKDSLALEPIVLPKPEKDGGKSVLASLWARRTDRNIKPDALPPQVLSNLLWAAFGVNRPEGLMRGKPGRTAASASNSQEIDLYVALPEGVYLYEAGPHKLTPVAEGDLRARAGRGKAQQAPVNIFAAKDLKLRPEQRVLFAQTVGYPEQA